MRKELRELIEKHSRKDKNKENEKLLKIAIEENKKLRRIIDAYNDNKDLPSVHNYSSVKTSKKTDAGAMIALLSDIHAEHKITKESTNGYNRSNPDIIKRRLEKYFKNLVKLQNKFSRDIELKTLIWGWLGDFIHGLIHDEYMRTNYMSPPEAVAFVTEELARGLNYILETGCFDKIIIVCKVGNHSRTTEKIFSDDEAVLSYEWIIYQILKEKYPQIEWIIENSYYSYLKIGNKLIRFHHGHEVRYSGGIGGFYVPLNRHRLRANQHKRADLTCLGHFHSADWLRNWQTLINGSVCGYDAYAIRKGFEPEPPQQQLLILDYKRGFTINTPIILE